MEGLAHNISAYSTNLSQTVEMGVHKIEKQINETDSEVNNAEVVFMDVNYMLILNQHIQSVTEMLNNVAADCR